jgi:hypothetical protein
MSRFLFLAGLLAGSLLGADASAQTITGQTRAVRAYATSYEPFFDNITYTDEEKDSTTATGAYSKTVSAKASSFTNDFGIGEAVQISNVNAATNSFGGFGTVSADTSTQFGADSTGLATNSMEVRFTLRRAGELELNGYLLAQGIDYNQGTGPAPENVFAKVEVIDVGRGLTVASQTAQIGPGATIDPFTGVSSRQVAVDSVIALRRGQYKVVITAYADTDNGRDPNTAVSPFAEFDVSGVVRQF